MDTTTVQRLSMGSKFGLYPRDAVLQMTNDEDICILQIQNVLYGYFIVEFREIKHNKETK